MTEDGVELSKIYSPGVLSESNELECDEQFLDTQYFLSDEDAGNQEGAHSGSTEDGENEAELMMLKVSLKTNVMQNEDWVCNCGYWN